MGLGKIRHSKLGELLISRGFIRQNQLEEALEEQKKTKHWLGEILVRFGFINEEVLYTVLAEQFGVEHLELKTILIPKEVINQVPVKLATHYKMIPIRDDGSVLTLATSNPISVHMIDDLRLILSRSVRLVLARESEVMKAINKYYGIGAETMDKITPETGEAGKIVNIQAQETQQIGDSSESASIIHFVNQILFEAYKLRATDIHIEPYEDSLAVRYRIDGVLSETMVPPTIKNFQASIVSRIKIMSNLDISETRLPQDGRIRVRIGEADMDLRVSTLPTPYGESVVIRLLSGNMYTGIENLGLLKRDQKVLERLISKPYGIIFVTGPTGSGKTTTLYAALNKINNRDRKIITIEDPIEYGLKGVTQIQVYSKIDLTFSSALRSILRHDPDVIMVGEVRDYETAEITIRVALTGHLVFSTLHTNNAATGVTRLIDMGVEPFLVTAAVQCFIAQRLVRLICPECKKETEISPSIFKEFKVEDKSLPNVKFYEGRGCESCKFTGFKGRTAIYELLVINAPIKELILQRASSEKIEAMAVAQGMRTLRQDGWEKVLLGLTTPDEVIRATEAGDLLY